MLKVGDDEDVDPPFHNFNFQHLLYQGLIKIKSTPPTKLWWWFDFLFFLIFTLFGEMIQFDDIIFFRWVVSTTNQKKIHQNTSSRNSPFHPSRQFAPLPVHPAAAADVATDLVRTRGTDLCQVGAKYGQQIAVRG